MVLVVLSGGRGCSGSGGGTRCPCGGCKDSYGSNGGSKGLLMLFLVVVSGGSGGGSRTDMGKL